MEWTVVGVIITLIGFAAAIVTPIVKLTKTITKLTVVMDVLRETGGKLFVDPAIIGKDPWKYLYGTTGYNAEDIRIKMDVFMFYNSLNVEQYDELAASMI